MDARPDAPEPAREPQSPPRHRLDPRGWSRRGRRIGAAALAALALFLLLALLMPVDRALEPLPEPSVILLDRHGEPFSRRGAYKDAPVTVDELPEHVVQAVLAIEDQRFYAHPGLDPRGIARAAARNAEAGTIEQGGSTITQQLAKNAFLGNERTLRRKIQEVVAALWLELRLDKDEILSRYLSTIYFGDGVHGLRAAARHYFDKDPAQLDLAEAAMLAGMIKAPSALAPTRNPEAARERARLVLRQMVQAGMIDEKQARAAGDARVRKGRAELPVGGYFADWVSRQAKQAAGPDYGEQRVSTTLDGRLQRHAERVVRRALDGRGRALGAGQAALVAMNRDGEVLALVGGRDYAQSQFDRATQARRQPGSVFKLFVYLAALREGRTPEHVVEDTPLDARRGWQPANYDGRYEGTLSLREAFARSSNVAAVRLADEVGPRAVVRAARDLGIESELSADPTIALGTSEVSLLELTAAFAALPAGESPVRPRGIPRDPGEATEDRKPLDPLHQAMLLDLLWGAVEQGTGRAARLRTPVFGKTGTTQDHRDAWFVGLAGDLAVGVWVGNDDNTPMKGVTGGGLPAEIWRDFTAYALDDPGLRPERVVQAAAAAGPAPAARRALERVRAKLRAKGRGNGRGRGR
ncbi:MAG: transglycosylase domain-containing protein [Gammaproteobacteria bacterium]|jgi:penicillin-binding protein 1A